MSYIDEDGDYYDLSDFSCGECGHFDELNCYCWVRWIEKVGSDCACEHHSELEHMQKGNVQ